MQACCRMTKQISRGFRVCFGVKKILKCCGKFFWEPRQLSTKQGKMRKQISGGFRAYLGREQIQKQFRKLGREGLQRQRQKTDT